MEDNNLEYPITNNSEEINTGEYTCQSSINIDKSKEREDLKRILEKQIKERMIRSNPDRTRIPELTREEREKFLREL